MTKNIEPGTEVMHRHGTYIYGGPAKHEGMETMHFDLRYGSKTSIFCDVDSVAPVEMEATVNLKDPRIEVIKHAKKPGYWASGPWEAKIQGDENSTWHKTKKDGVEEKARKLAIRDWHAKEEVTVEI